MYKVTDEELEGELRETNVLQGDGEVLQYDDKSYWRREGDGSAAKYCRRCNDRWESCRCEE